MRQYILKRLLLMIPTLFGVAVLIFFLLRVVPGDIVELKYAGTGSYAPKEALARERAQLGLDKPIWQQFVSWIWGIVRLDFGTSMWTGQPITHEIAIRLELSIELALMATFVAVLISIPLGALAAVKQDTWIDYFVRIFSIAGLSIPSFWLGIVIILTFIIYFRWLPPLTFTPFWWVDPKANLSQLIWPALAVGYRYSAVATRMTRSAMLEVLREDYVRTARAKGLWERAVVIRHALKNALLPVITVIGIEFAFLVGGLVVTEQVFNLNGIGKLFVEAISQRVHMVESLVLLTSFVFIFVNFLVDLVNAFIDPRIRYQ
jgi:peptide/nickel transport system permease protein